MFLASQEPGQLEKFLATGPWEATTEFTVTQPKVLAERLRKVRSQG